MLIKVLFGALAYVTVLLCDKLFTLPHTCSPAFRHRIIRFGIFQDVMVILYILKMMIFQGYSFDGVIEELRSAGFLTKLYVATSVVLHGALLFDEATNHHQRLTPQDFMPPGIQEEQRDIFLL